MAPQILSHAGHTPRIAADAFVAPGACLIGDVELGARSSVWFGSVVRGDVCHVRIGRDTNLQDGTVVHVARAGIPTLVGDGVTVGHGCILHACSVEDGAVIGMGAMLMDGAVVERDAMLAAGSLLAPGKRVPTGELWLGRPAQKLRSIAADEVEEWRARARHYVELAREYRLAREGADRG